MHRLSWLLAAALGALAGLAHAESPAAAGPAPATGGLRYTIAVTKFENHSKYPGQFALADCWEAVLTDSLQRSGHFIVLGEADMRSAALGEQDFAHSGRAAQGDKAPAAGAMTPAQLLIKGEITHFQDGTEGGNSNIGFGGLNLGFNSSTVEINAVVYVVDASTGQVLASKQVEGKAKNTGVKLGYAGAKWTGDLGQFRSTNLGKAVSAAIDEAVAFCTAQLPRLRWTGEVILVKDSQVYINRGAREGVAVGEVFRFGSSEELRDPGTGEVLDVNFTPVGELRVDAVKEKLSICSLVSGPEPAKGMNIAPH